MTSGNEKLNFINETCLKVFCYKAVICIKNTYNSVGMEMHLIKEQLVNRFSFYIPCNPLSTKF